VCVSVISLAATVIYTCTYNVYAINVLVNGSTVCRVLHRHGWMHMKEHFQGCQAINKAFSVKSHNTYICIWNATNSQTRYHIPSYIVSHLLINMKLLTVSPVAAWY
jgi:hypothetical protein